MSDAAFDYYRRWPERYSAVATKIDLCWEHQQRPCIGSGCDDQPCKRHARTLEVVERLSRMWARR